MKKGIFAIVCCFLFVLSHVEAAAFQMLWSGHSGITIKGRINAPRKALLQRGRNSSELKVERTRRWWRVKVPNRSCGESYSVKLSFHGEDRQIPLAPLPCSFADDLRFLVIGDTQSKDSDAWKRHSKIAKLMNKLAVEKRPHFILHLGDVIQEAEDRESWDKYLEEASPYLSQIPTVFVVGNHDYLKKEGNSPKLFNEYFGDMLNEISLGKIEFPHFKLVVSNSNIDRLDSEAKLKQDRWIDQELELAAENDKDVVMAFHHPPFSTTFWNMFSMVKYIRSTWIKSWEEKGITTMVFSGHSHLYEKSVREGTLYFTTGPAGGRKSFFSGFNPFKIFVDKDRGDSISFFKWSWGEAHYKSYRPNGKIFDQGSWYP